jgi:hypothetical protein
MSIATLFSDFIDNLAIKNTEIISMRYGELTSALNKQFRDTESKTAYTIQVGSFGRKTGINGISDLDMLYLIPKSLWDYYKDNKQDKLLQDTKTAISNRYPRTDVRVDRLVVTVTYTDFHVEVQPVFEQDDSSFKYPDTYEGGSWKITKPREEMTAVSELDQEKNSNLRKLCKMARAWKNKHGVEMGGLLIDTLVYNFMISINEYDSKSYNYYDNLSRDFFKYLSDLPDQDRYNAPGSNQHVKVKKKFQKKAKKAYELCLKAIEAEGKKEVNDKWRKIYGRQFPANEELTKSAVNERKEISWVDTEQFIEDLYPIDIRYNLSIDCKVKKDGFRDMNLREKIDSGKPVYVGSKLMFYIDEIDVPGYFKIKWKVLNKGEEAKKRNMIRGQIIDDKGEKNKSETADFKGDHIVECYAIKDGVVVARDRIDVPISNNRY